MVERVCAAVTLSPFFTYSKVELSGVLDKEGQFLFTSDPVTKLPKLYLFYRVFRGSYMVENIFY